MVLPVPRYTFPLYIGNIRQLNGLGEMQKVQGGQMLVAIDKT